MANWWIKTNGTNALKGIDDDDDNPPRLTAEEIAYNLRMSRQARIDYNKLYPDLLAGEQARLDAIIACNPRMTQLIQDYQTFHDAVQSNHNKAGVRLTWMK